MARITPSLIYVATLILVGNQAANAMAIFGPSIFRFSLAWFSNHGPRVQF